MLAGVPGYAEPALQQESFKTARETWPNEEQEAPEEGPFEPAASAEEADAQESALSDQPGTPASN